MKMVKVWFDMDGTIADLYGQENWLKRLRDNDASIFTELEPMVDVSRLMRDILNLKDSFDIEISVGVITWTPMEATYKYHKQCELTKLDWLDYYTPMAFESDYTFFALPYGTPKQSVVNKSGLHILIDDNLEVIKMWDTKKHRKSISADVPSLEWDAREKYFIDEIKKLITELF